MTDKMKKEANEIFAGLDAKLSEHEKAQTMFMEGAKYALNIIGWYVENHERERDENGCSPIEAWELDIYDAFLWAGFDFFLAPLEGDADDKAFKEYIEMRKSRGAKYEGDEDEED